jgi:hypothetical protein
VATVHSPKKKKSARKLKSASPQQEEGDSTGEVDRMEEMIRSMKEEYELKLEMLRQQQEEEKAKLRDEFLSQQTVLFQKLTVANPVRPESPPIKLEKSPVIVLSKVRLGFLAMTWKFLSFCFFL